MADGVEVKFNLPAFKQQLEALGRDFERKTMRSATAAAAGVFKKQVIANLTGGSPKVRTGVLSRAIYIKRSKDSTSGREHYFVGVRQGKKARKRKGGSLDAFYWRFVEEGHLARGPGTGLKGGTRRKALERSRLNAAGAKRVKAYPFLAPAFRERTAKAVQVFSDIVQKRINRENRKRSKA